MQSPNPTYISYLFIAVFVGLVLQYLYALQYREPFPAIMMPRFTYQSFQNDNINYPEVSIQLFFQDSSHLEIDKQVLLREMHLPQRNKVLRRVFQPESPIKHKGELISWLRNRSTSISGRQDLDRVEFHWHQLYWKFGNTKEPIRKEFLGVKVIKLEE